MVARVRPLLRGHLLAKDGRGLSIENTLAGPARTSPACRAKTLSIARRSRPTFAEAKSLASPLDSFTIDMWDCYKQWRAKGAFFLTEPLDNHGWEWRCYMRDPDGLPDRGRLVALRWHSTTSESTLFESFPGRTLQDQFKSDGRDTPKLNPMKTKLTDQQTHNPESKSSREIPGIGSAHTARS